MEAEAVKYGFRVILHIDLGAGVAIMPFPR